MVRRRPFHSFIADPIGPHRGAVPRRGARTGRGRHSFESPSTRGAFSRSRFEFKRARRWSRSTLLQSRASSSHRRRRSRPSFPRSSPLHLSSTASTPWARFSIGTTASTPRRSQTKASACSEDFPRQRRLSDTRMTRPWSRIPMAPCTTRRRTPGGSFLPPGLRGSTPLGRIRAASALRVCPYLEGSSCGVWRPTSATQSRPSSASTNGRGRNSTHPRGRTSTTVISGATL